MKSTKFQLLQDDFNSALRDIRLLHGRIKELEEENKRIYKYCKSLEYSSERLAIENVQLKHKVAE